MSFPRYERYKDSGVEWLGDVPEYWGVNRMKNTVASCRNGIWGQEPVGDEWDIPCVRVADFDRQRLVARENVPTVRNVTAIERRGRVLRRGDLLLEKSGGGDLQPVGCVVLYYSYREAICSNFIARMETVSGFDASFCRYLHFAMYALRLTTRSINQTSGIQNLDQSAYLNEVVALPTFDEQERIGRFLDQETAKIDALIEEQRRLIELLKEKRQAVVSHAVTCLMSDNDGSGHTQYGDKLGHHIKSIEQGWSPQAEDRGPEEGEAAVLKLSAVKAGRFIGGEVKALPKFLRVPSALLLRDNDFLCTRANTPELVGDTCVVKNVPAATIFSDLIYRLTLQTSLLPSYLNLVMQSDLGRSLAKRDARGSSLSMVKLGHDHIRNWCIPVPPTSEQLRITETLDGKRNQLAVLIEQTEAVIALLNERRSALISAAVTGKIDVRQWAPTEAIA